MQFEHLDSGESIYFARELEQVKLRSYDRKYAPLKGRDFVPTDSSADPTDTHTTWREYDRVGQAKLVSSYSKDFPRVDIFGKENTSRIHSYGDSYGYNIDEIRAAARLNRPLEQMRRNAAMDALAQKIDDVIRFGDDLTGAKGLLNLPNVGSYTIPADGTGSSKKWADKTPLLVARDMLSAARKMVEDTLEIEQPNTMILPLTSYGYISETQLGTLTENSILKYFMNISAYVRTVATWTALEEAGDLSPSSTQSAKRMVIYRLDPDVLQVVIPVENETFAPEQEGLDYVIRMRTKCGGLVNYRPKAVLYADGF